MVPAIAVVGAHACANALVHFIAGDIRILARADHSSDKYVQAG